MTKKAGARGYSLGDASSRAIAGAIRSLIEAKGITQSWLAAAAEIPQGNLSDLLKIDGVRKRNFQQWQLESIADALDVTLASLLKKAGADVERDAWSAHISLKNGSGGPVSRAVATSRSGPELIAALTLGESPTGLASFLETRTDEVTLAEYRALMAHRPLTEAADDDYWGRVLTFVRDEMRRLRQAEKNPT